MKIAIRCARALLILSSAALVTVACTRDKDRDRGDPGPQPDPSDQDKSGVTTLTGASWTANESAIDRITFARCARERTCASVGPDKHFYSGEACLDEVRHQIADDLKNASCPNGIESAALEGCLDAIRSESCTNPIDAMSRLAHCRTSALCLRSEMPSR